MTKSEFIISTLTSLLVAVMLIVEVIVSNVVAYNQGLLVEDQRIIEFGSNADRMRQIVAADCSEAASDPAIAALMVRQDIPPPSNIPMSFPPRSAGTPPLLAPPLLYPRSPNPSPTHQHP